MTYQKGHYNGPQEQADAITRDSDPRIKAGLSHLEELGEDLYQDNFKGLEKIIKGIKSNIQILMPKIRKDIDYIISKNMKDYEFIEEILDNLLNFLYMGSGKEEFKRLNDYYSTINPEFSKEYEKFYDEILKE
jgi:hypothetical protein